MSKGPSLHNCKTCTAWPQPSCLRHLSSQTWSMSEHAMCLVRWRWKWTSKLTRENKLTCFWLADFWVSSNYPIVAKSSVRITAACMSCQSSRCKVFCSQNCCMYVMPVFTLRSLLFAELVHVCHASFHAEHVCFIRCNVHCWIVIPPPFPGRAPTSRLGFVKVFEKALSAAFPDNPVKRVGFLDDFQYEILIEFDPGSEAWSALTPRQQRRRKYFESVIQHVCASSPFGEERTIDSLGLEFSMALRRLLPYNFVAELSLAHYSQNQKPGGQLNSLETLVVSLHISLGLVESTNILHILTSIAFATF